MYDAIFEGLKKGKKGGVPRPEAVMRMTGHQMTHFALHSPAILEPLLTPSMKAHPAWCCWLKLVELYAVPLDRAR